jgi:hypothetical protein
MSERSYIIWSNEHARWWRPHSQGYTALISNAGRYTKAQATEICENANRYLPDAEEPNEVLVLAPECME